MMSVLRIALTGILFFVLGSCTVNHSPLNDVSKPLKSSVDQGAVQEGTVEQTGEVIVQQSLNDRRHYRFLQLENNLKVLLISDPDTDKSAASLSVGVGSFQNPQDRPGLAHFLEHMLFLGTEKYPEPGEYQAYISEHGGSHNAYTSMEETNYFFDVDANYLLPVLDRFSQFFVAPRLNQDYVDREQNAVESEYRLRIKEDNLREWDVLRELVNSDHPLSKFSVGNLDTLADRQGDPVREDLLAFYQHYYSANLMNLVVLGRENLDSLQRAVESRFAAVPNRNVIIEEKPVPLFKQQLPLSVMIKPVQEKRELFLLFPTPPIRAYWRTKPLDYLGHLLGNEEQGTLLMSLKSRGLAESLSAGTVYDSRVGAAFGISISLTAEGAQKTDQIEQQVFAWLELVKSRGIASWRYRELTNLGEIAFSFAEKKDPVTYVRQLSSSLHELPPAEVLRSPSSFYDFDAAVIEAFADYLTADNALITLVSPDVEADTETRLYNAPYRVEAVSANQLDAWQYPSTTDLRLPEPNPYIPDQLVLNTGESSPLPVKIESEKGSSLWFYQDKLFGTPKAVFDVRIGTPLSNSVKGQAMTDLYLALVRDQLVPEVYPAHLAGLGFNLSRWENGVAFSLEGYSQKQPVLLGTVLAAMKNPDWKPQRFERVKAALLREWRNSTTDGPMNQVFSQFSPLLRHMSHPLQRAAALEDVSLDELRSFANRLFRRGHSRFYAGGNLASRVAGTMMEKTLSVLGIGVDGDARLEYRVRKLMPTDLEYLVAVDHNDSALILYIQGDEDSLRERARLALLQMVTSAPFYTSLRTEKQLGYQVGNTIAHLNRVPGLIFYIQSPVATSDRLQQEVNRFLVDFSETVAAMTDEDLNRIRSSVLANIEEAPKNLGELANRHLESLDLDYEGFDFRSRLAREVREVGLEELKQAYMTLLPEQRRALWVLSLPVTPGQEGDGIARRRIDRGDGSSEGEGEVLARSETVDVLENSGNSPMFRYAQ